MQLVYKIRRATDGLFSTGGTVPSFNKKGKTWSHRGHVSSHLSQLSDKQKSHSYKDCEVVAYEILYNLFNWCFIQKSRYKSPQAKQCKQV